MQRTRIDIIVEGKKETLPGSVSVSTVKHGKWVIDKDSGKHLCLIEIEIPERGMKVNFVPSEAFEDELLNGWLAVEEANNHFEFANPIMGETRPSQLAKKLQHLYEILKQWAGKHNINLEERRLKLF